MKNILDAVCRESTLARAASLTPDSHRRWGRMTVDQMVCHLGDQIRLALGDMSAADKSNVFTRTGLKWMVLGGMPTPKGKIQTFPELDQAAGAGTRTESLAADVATLGDLVTRFIDRAAQDEPFRRNPVFGALSRRQWGRLVYVHMHHHLAQFGA